MKSDAPVVAQTPGVWLCRALALGLGLTVLTHAALAQQTIRFDIPALPLGAALEQYAHISGRNALYNSNLTDDRRSTALQGEYSPEDALAKLLEGTGLSTRPSPPNSFVLLPVPAAVATAPPPAVTDYHGRIQLSLQRALCAESEARPGNYRIAMRLWIDAGGNVARYERVGSTGLPGADEGIDRALRRLQIGAPPPASFAQPVVIAIRPLAPGVTMGCESPAIRRAGAAP